jgi:hypothetical protein
VTARKPAPEKFWAAQDRERACLIGTVLALKVRQEFTLRVLMRDFWQTTGVSRNR